MTRKSMTTLTALAAAALFASTVAAQTAPQTAPRQDPPGQEAELRAKGEAYSRAPDSEQNPAEVSTTVQLNTEIAAQNEAAELMEMRSAEAGAEAETQISADTTAADSRYQADMAAYEAAQAEYMQARATWEGLIQACVASGRRDCTPTPPPADMPPPPPAPPVG